ncbi:Ig-like domain-containing protein [Pseudomonas chlororaphis]|uniref:Ig-like domain-containing protein n=1 Tax=Pseudomonas chlororaphis TaxID=587753 RepID=UPI001927A1A2|nr:Ig-like domain-containing protein [Pseudomonas chlororaphis]QQX57082.1 hypothetical protein JHW28_21175 [Pseudomonas chlororaphis subsp. aurantiaca]
MSSTSVNVAVVDGVTITQSVVLRTTKKGTPVKIKAIADGKYILAEGEKGAAPENITLKRVGDDLYICLEDTELDQPQMIIEDFFLHPGVLLGLAEDGAYYQYVTSDADSDHEAAFLIDGDSSAHVLGIEPVTFPSGLVAASGVFWPGLIGLGVLGALGGVWAASGNSGGGGGHRGGGSNDEVILTPSLYAVIDDVGSIQGPIAKGGVTDDANPILSGTGQPGNTIEIWDNKQKIGEAQVDGSGNWTFSPEVPLADGQHSVVIVEKDAQGNTSSPSESFDFVVDTIAPNVAEQTLIDDVGPTTGVIVDGTVTDDNTPTLDGTAEPGSTVIVSDNGVEIGEVVVAGDGTWSFTPETPLADGGHSISTVVVDEAGNRSPESNPIDFVVDTTPAVPVDPPEDGTDTPAPVNPDEGGTDITAPSNSGINDVVDNVGPDTGSIPNGGTTNDDTPTISGEGEPGDQVVIIQDGEEVGKVVVDENGQWDFTPETPLDEGTHDFVIVIEDPAGNQSDPSDGYIIIVDKTAPESPVITSVFDDQGAVTGDLANGATTDDSQPKISGTAEASSTVVIYDNGVEIGRAPTDASGAWTFEPSQPLSDGGHSLTAKAVDAAGNISEPSNVFDLTLVTGTVPSPVITGVLDDQGSVTGNVLPNGVTDDARPVIQGTATAGSSINVYADDVLIGTAVADASGQWQVESTIDLPEGLNNITATAANATGNVSPSSSLYPIVVDTTAPNVADQTLIDDVGPITGVIVDGTVTDDSTPTLDGTAEPGSTVIVSDNGVEIGEVVVAEDGTWSFTPETPLADGGHSISTVVVDEAGNRSPESNPIDFVVDTTPAVPVDPPEDGTDTPAPVNPDEGGTDITAPSNSGINDIVDNVGPDTGSIPNGGTTNDDTPTISGEGEPGDQVVIIQDGEEVGKVVVDENGQWDFTPETPLDEGTHDFVIVIEDPAGNQSDPSDGYIIIVDKTAPESPVITSVFDDQGAVTGDLANGATTDDSQPKISGTAEASSTVVIYDNGVEIGRAPTDASGAWTFEPSQPLSDGGHSLTAKAVDAAGNISEPSNVFDLTLVTGTVPSPVITGVLDDQGSVTGNVLPNGVTDDARPVIQGTATAGSSINVYADDVLIGTAVADASGQWQVESTIDLPEGLNNITATAANATGNVSPSSSLYPIVVDTTAPNVADQTLIDDVGPITGVIVDGTVTDDSTPTLDGTAEPGSTVIVSDNGVEIGEVVVAEDGTWSFTPETPLADGGHSISTVVVDEAGNRSPASDPIDFVVDTTAPSNSGINDIVDNVGPDTGSIPNGGTTNDDTPTISGEGEPGDQVVIIQDGEEVGKVVVDENGQWDFTPETPLDEGTHDFVIVIEDPAGNQSDPSDGYIIIVDKTAPESPVITSVFDDQGAVTGDLANGATTDDSQPKISGTAEASSTVVIYDNGVEIGRAPTDASGAWTFEPSQPLSDGGHSLTAKAVDAAGNISEPSNVFDLTLVTGTVPSPVITGVLDDQGSVTGNVLPNGVTDDARPVIQGTATAGSSINVYADDVLIGTAVADASGQWQVESTIDLPEGLNNITATAANATGNVSPSSSLYPIVVDTTAPNVADQTLIDDVGPITGVIVDGTVTDDSTPTLDGTAEPGSTVIVSDNGVEIGEVVVAEDGTWSFTPETPLADGGHSISTVVVDEAGNRSPASDPIDFVVDTTAPSNSGINDIVDNVGPDTGSIPNGGTTNDDTPTISGEGEPGDQVVIIQDGEEVGKVVVDENGQWDFTPETPLDEGTHDFVIVIEDPAGNQSDPSDGYIIIVDKTAPESPVITSVFDDQGAVTGDLANGATTDDSQPKISGTAEASSTVVIYDNGVEIGRAPTDASGAWTFEPSQPLSDGGHSLTAKAVDAAGNISEPSNVFDLTLVTGTVPSPVITGVLDDQGSVTGNVLPNGVTDDARPVIQGTATAGSSINVYADDVLIGTAVADASGQWQVESTIDLPEGLNNITATAANATGNVSPSSSLYPIVVDTTAPNVADQTLIDDVGPITGVIVDGTVTDDSTPTLDGTAEPGSTVIVSDNGVEIGEVVVAEDGTWSFTPETPLADGGHSISTVVVDEAGNRSPASDPIDFVVDTTAPSNSGINDIVDNVGPDTGSIPNGGTTNDDTPTISGEGEPGDQVVIIQDGEEVGKVVVDENGQWDFTPETPLDEGTHDFVIVIEDPAGNQSDPSDGYIIIVDKTAPESPVITSVFDDQGAVTGDLANGATTDDSQPKISGTAEASSTVVIYDNGVEIGRAPTDASGAWTFEPSQPLSDGGHSLTAKAVDAAGNISEPSNVFDLTLVTGTVPSPVITGVLDDQGSVTGNVLPNGVTDDARPVIQGTATAGSSINVYADDVLIGTAVADASGQWQVESTIDLPEGLNNITATAANATGNVSPSSSLYPIVVDTTAPNVADQTLIDDVGPITGVIVDGTVTDDSTPTLDGTAEPGSTVIVSDNGVEIGEVVVAEDGTWSFTPETPLADGGHSISTVVVDEAGNRSPASDPIDFVVDTMPLTRAVITSMGKDSGTNSGDFLTNNGTAGRLIQGGLSAALAEGETVQVSTDGGINWLDAVLNGDSTWSFVDQSSHSGDWEIQARVVNSIGNSNTVSQTVTMDTVAPNTPTDIKVDRVNGTVLVSLDGTGAQVGDVVAVLWGDYTVDYTLVESDIDVAQVVVVVAAEVKSALPDPDVVAVGLVDSVGNSSDSRYVSRKAVVDFEGVPNTVVAPGESIDVSGVRVTVVTAQKVGASIDGVRSGIASSPANKDVSERLIVTGTVKVEFLDGEAPSVSFLVGNAQMIYGRYSVVFYDSEGVALQTIMLDQGEAAGSVASLAPFTVSYEAASGTSIAYMIIQPVGGATDLITIDNIAVGGEVSGIMSAASSYDIKLASDSYHGSEGNDLFNLSSVEYFSNASSGVHGGAGLDTLKLTGSDQILDLNAIGEKLTSIEIIDLTGTGDNSLNLSLENVLNLGEVNLFHDNEMVQMMVKGDAGDVVNLNGLVDTADSGKWVEQGGLAIGDTTYQIYQHSTLAAELLVQQGMQTNLV